MHCKLLWIKASDKCINVNVILQQKTVISTSILLVFHNITIFDQINLTLESIKDCFQKHFKKAFLVVCVYLSCFFCIALARLYYDNRDSQNLTEKEGEREREREKASGLISPCYNILAL